MDRRVDPTIGDALRLVHALDLSAVCSYYARIVVKWQAMGIVYNRIAEILADAELSRIELAELAGLSYQSVCKLARGRGNPKLIDAIAIARVLDYPLKDLFWLQRDEQSPLVTGTVAGPFEF